METRCHYSGKQINLKTSKQIKYWTFSFTPINTCVLDGNYVFRFLIKDFNGRTSDLTFFFASQYFCGQITNTSVTGSVKLYADPNYTNASNIFNENDLIYVWVSPTYIKNVLNEKKRSLLKLHLLYQDSI
jgi:hypothetical protein